MPQAVDQIGPEGEQRGGLAHWRDYFALTKPSITGMNLFAALGGLALAGAGADWCLVLATGLGTCLAVGSANALNMLLEREGDRAMTRTARRPLPAGRMRPVEALTFGLVLGLLSALVLGLLVNPLTMAIGLAAIAGYVLIYTPLKRRSPLALLVGAIPGAAPPLMGWTAATGEIGAPGLVLFGVLLLWQLPHFLAITIYRRADYSRAGIKTVSVVRGDLAAKAQALAWTTALVPLSLALVPLGVAGPFYGVTALAMGLWYLLWSLRGFAKDAGGAWARKFFFASLVYMPALILFLAIDVALP